MVGFPYPKFLNANMQVDQGAALILCSLESAHAAGIDESRLVFPISGADAFDHWFVSERENLHSSPAIRECGRAALGLAGITIDDIKHVDLYSCFPVAVEIGAAELGLSLDRQLTLTGGLTFGGGPGNNYVTHSIAQLVDKLRGDPGTLGLVNANGWYVTKHAVGVYGTEPPKDGFRAERPQAEVDAGPKQTVIEEHDGPITVESFTVLHDREGAPDIGVVACLVEGKGRAWGNTRDADLMHALMTEDLIGRPGTLKPDGTVTIG
jgi:acetyl-CoA C-acetyltransferase